ncbi:MAG: helix-turn-helix domain-containing protein [Bacteroidota bacterium]
MLQIDENLTMVDKHNGNLALKLFFFDNYHGFDHIQRLNYYSMIWVVDGSGIVRSDFSEYGFQSNSLMAFTPYQPFMISGDQPVKGVVLNFHPDFFCIHHHHESVACNGILFNNIYSSPIVKLNEKAKEQLERLLFQIKEEMIQGDLAQYEVLVSYLKVVLITVSRQKAKESDDNTTAPDTSEPFVLKDLKRSIEDHFRSIHSPSEYAEMLNISPKALGKITKKHFNKTMTDLIAERIMIEAKRELYMTDKQVKLIASELGYQDEYYFSRFFKNNADISPQMYRETVGFARGIA